MLALCGTGELESVTVTVKMYRPDALTLPEITPVDELIPRPLGGAPLVMDQNRGAIPPEVETPAE